MSVSWEPGLGHPHGRAPTPLPAPNPQDGSRGRGACAAPRWERRSQERSPGGHGRLRARAVSFRVDTCTAQPPQVCPISGAEGGRRKRSPGEPQHPVQLHHPLLRLERKVPRRCQVPSGGHLRPRALVCSEHISPELKSTPCPAARRGAASGTPLCPPASSGHEGPEAEMRPGTPGLQPRG